MATILASTSGIIGGAPARSVQSADNLSKRTEQQAASLEETAACAEEITATIKKTAQNAKEDQHDRHDRKIRRPKTGGQVVETANSCYGRDRAVLEEDHRHHRRYR
jgi:methyl-accepting chemotaxis protein